MWVKPWRSSIAWALQIILILMQKLDMLLLLLYRCAEGFTGQFCNVSKDSNNYQAMVIGLSVMSAVLLMLLVGCCVYCCCTRRHQWKSGHGQRRAYEQTPSEYSGEAPDDVSYNGGDKKNILTPKWSSEYTTPMYKYYDHTSPSSTSGSSSTTTG